MQPIPFLRLHLLGTPWVDAGGAHTKLTAARPIALLAYLALTTTPQPREHVLDLLWTDSTVDAGRKNLRNALWALRKTFGEDIVHTNGDYLSLGARVWVDACCFEQTVTRFASATVEELETAAALYRGALLNGVAPDHAPEFEIWLTMARERFLQLYLQTLTILVERRQSTGDWGNVILLARRGLQQDPLQEHFYQALMTAHALRGERSEALRQYEALRQFLNQELGIEPLPETQALRTAIGRGELRPVASIHLWGEHRLPALTPSVAALPLWREAYLDRRAYPALPGD